MEERFLSLNDLTAGQEEIPSIPEERSSQAISLSVAITRINFSSFNPCRPSFRCLIPGSAPFRVKHGFSK